MTQSSNRNLAPILTNKTHVSNSKPDESNNLKKKKNAPEQKIPTASNAH